jgi:hypothetical protein
MHNSYNNKYFRKLVKTNSYNKFKHILIILMVIILITFLFMIIENRFNDNYYPMPYTDSIIKILPNNSVFSIPQPFINLAEQ